MTDNKGRFQIDNFSRKSGFSNFLPGISGEHGIPIWCYYVNRGQCITSFGVEDKNHSIMEFYPAHQAYRHTKRMGFRTFIKVDGKNIEAFTNDLNDTTMYIGMNELEIVDYDKDNNLEIKVRYCTLPGEELGGLVRIVTISNKGNKARDIELLDGMPAVIPYGVSLGAMKDMGQTAKAWMEVLDHEKGVPFFHVRASMEDTAEVKEISGGNFAFAFDGENEKLPVIVDCNTVFSYDTSLEQPVKFKDDSLKNLLEEEQITKNDVPCCFFAKKKTLNIDDTIELYEIFGQTESKEILYQFYEKVENGKEYFTEKAKEAVLLTEELTRKIATVTGSRVFDRYCRQTYLDNVLRGGSPIHLGGNKIFYLYSRKHGDIERDYNFFRMLPEYYSQGNGNFRDVNQNRRCDVQFSPYVKAENIKAFYNFIQINGYNPLGIEKITYRLEQDKIKACMEIVNGERKEELAEFLSGSFTPGRLYQKLCRCFDLDREKVQEIFDMILQESVSENKTDFIEGYWTDHWTYNLDLIESYLLIYPDKEEDLLFEDNSYIYTSAAAHILPRNKRYIKTEKGIRQYHFLEEVKEKKKDYLTTKTGELVQSSLIEKLFLISVVKASALDSYGMGIEMEGGKPGWYDALNGLPGLLGSSMSETFELARNIQYTLSVLKRYPKSVDILEEVSIFANKLGEIIDRHITAINESDLIIGFWNEINEAKEHYFESTKTHVSGKRVPYTSEQLCMILEKIELVLNRGIEKAVAYGNGISPTYFYYTVEKYVETEDGIYPTELKVCNMPYFLEGAVRYLKLDRAENRKKELYDRIKKSELYDKKLKMYKVNASLENASYELGRARAFTPGWLENESIWLHMEYKYLLELLKSGLYEEYIEDFRNAAVPFLDEEIYGRSLFENSSFIASSANPNRNIHGKGFVARLSGSTAEFMNMWQLMMFGHRPFSYMEGELSLCLKPIIPHYLIDENKKIEVVFLGEIPVVYYLPDQKNFTPGSYRVDSYIIYWDGNKEIVQGEYIGNEMCNRIRRGKVERIEVVLIR